MRIEQLEYLTAVSLHGSLRRASERLHLSQPALSEAVTKLERELGVTLLDRRRSGARVSRRGRDLQPYMAEVLDAVDRLRAAAGDQRTSSRLVRIGTVHTATASLLVPALHRLQVDHPTTTVEVVSLPQADVDQGLVEGSLDLGLVNVLDGDDPPPDLAGVDLLRGRPVVVMPADHPLAQRGSVSVEQLSEHPFVAMRPGYLMHRYVRRLLGGTLPPTSHTADGAEMGKLLVAEGLGLTVLPDYSVSGDPLERAGALVTRPLEGETTGVTLVLRHRPAVTVPTQVRELRNVLVGLGRAAARESGTAAAVPASEHP